jgi:F420-dependent oxidoreductase-like protein
MPVELRIFTEPQMGASYDTLLAVARRAEQRGFGAFFRSDHYMAFGGSGLPGSTDAWATIAALARETSTIRLGTMVTPATFRYPGVLAITVAQADQMSGGRVELGLGAGWFEPEHKAYAIPFPPTGERFERLEDTLAIVRGLWDVPVGERFSYAGTHHSVEDSPGLPKPVQQPRVPIIVGGHGPKTTPRLAAAYADEFNLGFSPVDGFVQQRDRVSAACEQLGRDPASMTWSVALTTACGSDGADVDRRAAATGQRAERLRANGLCGTPSEVVEQIGRYADAGADRVYLQILDLDDLEHLDLLAAEVMPSV